ncbi:hypothetical protein JCM5296_002443 [Sporobolomyces johnsonii]
MLAAATALFALVASASAQALPSTAASPEQLALVDAQYNASGFPDSGDAGFGISLNSQAILTVSYASFVVQNGNAYTAEQVATAPTVYVTPSTASRDEFNSSSTYTVMLADASSLGDPDTAGNYRHYLVNGQTGTSTGSNYTFEPSGGTVITSYAGPGPIAGTGPHRYAWLLFTQPGNFQAPSNLSATGTAPSHWYVSSYVQETGLELVAASFFTIENGNPTGSVASTQAINTATLSYSGASSSTGSSTGSSSAASSTATAKNASSGAAQVAVSLAAGLLGVVGVVAMTL